MIAPRLFPAGIGCKRGGIGADLVGDIFQHRTGRNFAGRQHPTWMSHHAELNSEAELIVIAPAQINLEAIRRGQ